MCFQAKIANNHVYEHPNHYRCNNQYGGPNYVLKLRFLHGNLQSDKYFSVDVNDNDSNFPVDLHLIIQISFVVK